MFTALVLGIGTMNLIGDYQRDQAVLGKSDERSGKNEQRHSEEEKQREEKEREEHKQEAEKEREERKQEIEREFKVKTDELELEIKARGGEIERKIKPAEVEDELSHDEAEDLKDTIEEEFEEEHEVEIATSGGDVVIKKNKVKVRTGFPLSINPETNELTVTRPDGTTKVVTVLPDKAVENFMKHKKIEIILPDDPTGTDSAGTDPVDPDDISTDSADTDDQDLVELVEEDDVLAYQIKAKEKFKLLGLFNVTGETTGYVSAETGEVIKEKRPFLTRLLDALSP